MVSVFPTLVLSKIGVNSMPKIKTKKREVRQEQQEQQEMRSGYAHKNSRYVDANKTIRKDTLNKSIEEIKRTGHRQLIVSPPEQTNENLVRTITSPYLKGPIFQRKHIYHVERKLRDRVIAHTPTGKRIFAYNDKKIPICFALLQNKGNARCQNIVTYINGRCKYHGGRAKRGLDHWNAKGLKNSAALPDFLANDYRRTQEDKDLLSLEHDIRITDVDLHQLRKELTLGLSSSALPKFDKL